MMFENIFLLPDEIKLLREMADEKPRSQDIFGISKLLSNGLISLENTVPTQEIPHSFRHFYKINGDGERFLAYLDGREIESKHDKSKEKRIFWLTILSILIAVVSMIISIVKP